jgi:peptidoglycan/LPS O-acetylase OafA/YrhL
MLQKIKGLQVISNEERISSIDIFRAIAIISVVLFHYNGTLPFGLLGVDLFFVISGLLIGGLLIKKYDRGEKIHFMKFILQRGFKIWPSYYSFIFFGSIIAYFFYKEIDASQIIPINDLKKYLFFYQNYTGPPFHWSFDHVWSLCVEEHFYMLLPILFILVQRFFKSSIFLFIFIILTIICGTVFKILVIFFTSSQDTYSATHNRIDALAWGVLLSFIIFYYGEYFKKMKFRYIFFIIGIFIFSVGLYLELYYNSYFYKKVIFHSLLPFCFFLMLLGLYYYDFTYLKILRIIAYYSYNWYLWHPLFVIYIVKYFGDTTLGLILYLILSFVFAIIFTVLIEEKVLEKREVILNKIFKNSTLILFTKK